MVVKLTNTMSTYIAVLGSQRLHMSTHLAVVGRLLSLHTTRHIILHRGHMNLNDQSPPHTHH